MSVMAELFVCGSDSEAKRYDTSPNSFRDREQYRNFTPLELSILWADMRGITWDAELMNDFPAVLIIDGGERTIHRLPDSMLRALAQLTSEGCSVLAGKWAATEEMACKPADVEPIINGLKDLAKKATGAGSHVSGIVSDLLEGIALPRFQVVPWRAHPRITDFRRRRLLEECAHFHVNSMEFLRPEVGKTERLQIAGRAEHGKHHLGRGPYWTRTQKDGDFHPGALFKIAGQVQQPAGDGELL
jgi:hypothetical protein